MMGIEEKNGSEKTFTKQHRRNVATSRRTGVCLGTKHIQNAYETGQERNSPCRVIVKTLKTQKDRADEER